MPFTSHIFPSGEEVAKAFAKHIALRIAESERYTLALSGGSTPKILFRELAEQYKDQIDWAKLHLFWGDERCVAPDHEESNFKMTNELLIQHVPIPTENVHRILGEAEPQGEAVRYEKVIRQVFKQPTGLPTFDMVMLGMGSDGHTASIFPDQMQLLSSSTVCAVATHPDSGQKRVSLTGPVINAAREIAFLVTGESKTEKVQKIYNQLPGSEAFPAAHIQSKIGETVWWLDESAARLINS